jgi:hypothetical protein
MGLCDGLFRKAANLDAYILVQCSLDHRERHQLCQRRSSFVRLYQTYVLEDAHDWSIKMHQSMCISALIDLSPDLLFLLRQPMVQGENAGKGSQTASYSLLGSSVKGLHGINDVPCPIFIGHL